MGTLDRMTNYALTEPSIPDRPLCGAKVCNDSYGNPLYCRLTKGHRFENHRRQYDTDEDMCGWPPGTTIQPKIGFKLPPKNLKDR